MRRVLANRELIWGTASEFLRRGVDVILDDGFFLRENRMRVVDDARRVGAAAKISLHRYGIGCDSDASGREKCTVASIQLLIGQDTLEAFAELFEMPTDDEGAKVVVVRDFARPASMD